MLNLSRPLNAVSAAALPALALPSCGQADEVEHAQGNESITLPDCAITCDVRKSCIAGCSVRDSQGAVATTCEQYMAGNCDGKGELTGLPDDKGMPNGGS